MVILGYDNMLEAYRKDRFSKFQVSPDPGGVIMNQQSYWGYYSASPIEGAAQGGGSDTGVILAVVGGVVVLAAAGGLVLARKRRSTADERE